MPTIRVAIAGATGYAGEELIRLLLHHPHVQLSYLAASAKWERPVPAADVFPRVAGRLSLPIEALDPARLAQSDLVFLALPHGSAMNLAPKLLEAGRRVVDLSGDFRLKDPSLYTTWYEAPHAAPSWLSSADVAYGLSEFYGPQVAKARLVANPGCYATSILLGCLPALEAGLINEGTIIVDAKSGLTGAGRKADDALLFSEMSENLRAYKVNAHQHAPEILQEIQRLTGRRARMFFVPQVVPARRGMVSMIYASTSATTEQVAAVYRQRYSPERTPCVRVRASGFPQMKDVVGTNLCDIGLLVDPALRQLLIVSALDNLTKGAAGQAIQNMNLMYGWPETTGLTG